MAGRIRSIKPEILEDEKTAALTHLEWRLFVSLWLLADDHGNLRSDPKMILGQALWSSGESPETVRNALESLRKSSLVESYTVRGQTYLHICSWEKHQKISHKGKPRMPTPAEGEAPSGNPPKSSGDSPESLRPDLRPAITDPHAWVWVSGNYKSSEPRHRGWLAESVWQRMSDTRIAVAKELGIGGAFPFPIAGRGLEDLRQRLRDEGDAAPLVATRVMEFRTAEARQTRSIDWLGEKTFTEGGWRTAREAVPKWRQALMQTEEPATRTLLLDGVEIEVPA